MVRRWVFGSKDSSCVEAPGARNPHCGTSTRKYKDRNIGTLQNKKGSERKADKVCLWFAPGVSYKWCTLKQVGHMVMLTSGSRERKYSHLSGRGQRLIRTSLLLIERSTERLTLTGTKFEPPCCSDRHTNTSMFYSGPRPFTLSSWSAQLVEY